MGLLQRIASSFNPMRRDPRQEHMWTGEGSRTEAGIAVTRENAGRLDIVGAIRETIAGSASTLPLMLYERLEGDGRKPAKDHQLYTVLHNEPNRDQSAQEFRFEMVCNLVFERNAYAFIVPDGDNPVGELISIKPSRVQRIERDSQGHRYYTIAGIGVAPAQVYRDDAIWHIRRGPLTDDGLRGIPIYETDRETFGKAIAVEQYGARWFKNSGQTGGIIKHPGNFKSKEDRDSFLENWRESSTGRNQHRDRLATHGVDYQPLAVQNDHAQFLETVRHMEIKICGLFNMPPHRVSRLDKATFSNIEQQGIEYVTHTLAPYIVGFEQAAMRDLLIGDDRDRYFIEHNVAGLLRGDIMARYKAYAIGRQNGWLSINDIRRMENLNPIPGGDEYLQPLNMQPVRMDTDDDEKRDNAAAGLH